MDLLTKEKKEMGRNRGQGNDKKKKEEVVFRKRGKPWRWPRNRERNLLREVNQAQRKLKRLMKRSRDGKPGGIMPASFRLPSKLQLRFEEAQAVAAKLRPYAKVY